MFANTLSLVAAGLALTAAASAAPLSKRSFSGQATYFDVGLGACGWTNSNSDMIVALNTAQYGYTGVASSYCGQWVTITNTQNGKTASAQIADACPTCSSGSLDMSPTLFQSLASGGLGEGVFPISWTVGGGGSNNNGGAQSSTTTSAPHTTQTQASQPTHTAQKSSSSSAAHPTSAAPSPSSSAPADSDRAYKVYGALNVLNSTQLAKVFKAVNSTSSSANSTEKYAAVIAPSPASNGTDLSKHKGEYVSIWNKATNVTALARVAGSCANCTENSVAVSQALYDLLAPAAAANKSNATASSPYVYWHLLAKDFNLTARNATLGRL